MNTDHPYPLLMVDVVLLTVLNEKLHVGLVRRENEGEPFYGAWCLPGGFIRPQEDLDASDTAKRVLATKAGVTSPYLEQLATFTGAARDPRGWSASIAYYALVPAHVAPVNSESFNWVPADDVLAKKLPFDHSEIVRSAVERVRSKTSYSALPVHLMPEEFTMTELRTVYEQILGGRLDKRGFLRRMDELDVLEETGNMKAEGHRPARLHRFKRGPGLAQLSPSINAK